MKIRKNASGFTLAELVLAVAILTILLGLATVNVIRYLRTLTQLERDGIAREIFVAAQNHLTMAESQGFLGVSNPGDSYKDEVTEETFYYLVSHSEEAGLLGEEEEAAQSLDMLYDVMLPFASVDETVRSGGSYVIRYQKNPALVRDVFYVAKSGRFAQTDGFQEEEISSLWGYSGPEKKRERREEYKDNVVIGWYGAEGGKLPDLGPGDTLNPPAITVTNAERLSVDVSNPNATIGDAGLHLIIKGEQSGNVRAIDLIDKTGALATGYTDKSNFHVVLDDVTSDKPDEHFCLLCKDLFPGENIIVYAEAYNNNKLTNIARSADAMTNSLFASLKVSSDDNPYDTGAVEISNFRHLENLDSKISNITTETVTTITQERDYYSMSTAPKPTRIMSAKQTGNLDWPTFESRTGNYVYYLDNPVLKTLKAGAEKCYLPITKSGMITYNGQGNEISNVEIKVAGDAGLFATLGNSSTVENLKLVNFSVKSSGGAAGALAGVLDGSTVSGVLAHGVDSEINVTSSAAFSAGGLIGKATGNFAVQQSAAAVYVKNNGTGNAGGLIGEISNTVSFTVRDSYAGGHTQKGRYEKDYQLKEYYNVDGKANTGGLIGNVVIGEVTGTPPKVENCYATTSVKGAVAGGLIGSMNDRKITITNCYATGLVMGTGSASDKLGAFVGVRPANASFSNDGYFSLVNGDMPAAGDETETVTGVEELDTDSTAYGAGNSKPYDQFLIGNYTKGPQYPDESLYTFLNIVELNRRTTPGWNSNVTWMKTHYGDWPPLDTLVINT